MTRKLPPLLLNIILNNRDNNEQISLSILEEYFVDPCNKKDPNILINPSQLWTPCGPNPYLLI
jgi:hypothetical protein